MHQSAAGLNSQESGDLNSLLCGIRDEHGIGILLIEHDMDVVMNVSDQVVVLDHGQKIAEGTPSQVKDDNAVIEAYLGKKMNDEEMRKALAV